MVLIRKDEVVFPSPFKTLINVVFVYKNGQIHARVIMNFPAVVLWKSRFPTKLPVKRKNKVHRHPRANTQAVTCLIRRIKVCRLFVACISAIVGSSMVDTELVTAEGKRIHGSAIPVRTP